MQDAARLLTIRWSIFTQRKVPLLLRSGDALSDGRLTTWRPMAGKLPRFTTSRMNGFPRIPNVSTLAASTPARVRTNAQRLARATEFDVVVADASWSWTERLFSPLADLGARVLLLRVCDWQTALVQGRSARDWLWPSRQLAENLWEKTLVLPPGWMKTLPSVGMRPIAWAVRSWRRTIGKPRHCALAISYPHYIELHRQLATDQLIYYNMDDYALYWSGHSKQIQAFEDQVVRSAALSVFCAKIRADLLADRVPDSTQRILHLPHGAPAEAIPDTPHHLPQAPPADLVRYPRPYLGFVGSLEDRLDWTLLEKIADNFPGGTVVLIGRPPNPPPNSQWARSCRQALKRPNVLCLGWRSQAQIAQYMASFDICLIPYLATHPFNRMASPTKIMDYMAATRPVVSTALPETELYSRLFHIAATPAEFVTKIQAILDRHSDDQLASQRWQTARNGTWHLRAESLWNAFANSLS